jgi:hypothetical protein
MPVEEFQNLGMRQLPLRAYAWRPRWSTTMARACFPGCLDLPKFWVSQSTARDPLVAALSPLAVSLDKPASNAGHQKSKN